MEELEHLRPDCYYHIYNRGNNRENLFWEEENYEFFLRQYKKYISPLADTFAYCLLRNHFHFLIRVKPDVACEVATESLARPHRTPQASTDPSRAFSNFFNSYAKSMNTIYGRTGSLFQERFRRKEIMGAVSLRAVVRYIHINPQKHRFVTDFRRYKHSSYRILTSDETSFLMHAEVLKLFGGKEAFEAFHLGEPE